MAGYDENQDTISLDADASIGIFTGPPGVPGSASPNAGMMYRFVKVTGTHQAGLCTAATDLVTGILQNKPQKPGAASTVAFGGVSSVIAGAAVAAGVLVAPDSVGRAVLDATNGRWLTLGPATVAGEMIPVLKIR